MILHVLDGTHGWFRHFYGQRRFNKGKDKPLHFPRVVEALGSGTTPASSGSSRR
jgi:hypothetical protein